jgi:ABC-2 type transport system permease protein
MGLMRYFPAKKAHQVLSFIGLMFLVGMVVYLRFLSPEKFFGQEISDERIILFMESLKVPDYKFLPTSWISYGLTSWVGGDFKIALMQSLYLYSTALIGLAVLWATGRIIYFDGWTLVQEANHAPSPKKEWEKPRPTFWKRLPISSTQRALLEKDMKLFRRDPEQWSQIFILCALVFVYIFNIMNLPLSNVVLKNVISVLNIGLIGFVLSALVSRFVFSATSLEGKSMWTIYSAPVEMKKFLWSKFWMFFPPLLLIAEFLLIVSNSILQVDSYVMLVSFVGVFLVTLGLVGMGIGLGAVYPSFNHDNVSEIPTGTGGILFMTLSLGFVGLVLMLVGRPMYVHFNEKFLFKSLGGIDVPICYTLIFILSLIAAYLPIRRGIRSLNKMDL